MFKLSLSTNEYSISQLTTLNNTLTKSHNLTEIANDHSSNPETSMPDLKKISKNSTTNSGTTNQFTNPNMMTTMNTHDSEDEDEGWSTKVPAKHSKNRI
jgi:uncharacterized protein YjgD (DUF1641 family)